MTRAELNERYQLVKQITEGVIHTFHAVAQTGAVVMVHVLEPRARSEQWQILGLMDRLTPTAKGRIVEVVEVDGAPVVVTRILPDFISFRGWLESNGEAPARSVAPAGPAASMQARPMPGLPHPGPGESVVRPGEFRPGLPTATPRESAVEPGESRPTPAGPMPVGRAPAAGGGPSPAPPPAPAEDSPTGEFTKIFRAQVPPGEPRPAASPEPMTQPGDAVPRSSAGSEPGEFTRIFRRPTDEGTAVDVTKSAAGDTGGRRQEEPAAPPAGTEPPAPSPPEPAGPGEFTEQFARQTGQPPVLRPDTDPQLPLEPPAKSESPGEFTQRFAKHAGQPPVLQPDPGPQPPPEPPAEPKSQGEFTRWFAQRAGQPPVLQPDPQPQPSPEPPAKSESPGEFTQWFAQRAGQPPVLQPDPRPQPPPEPPADPKSPGEFTQWFVRRNRPEQGEPADGGLSYRDGPAEPGSGETEDSDWRGNLVSSGSDAHGGASRAQPGLPPPPVGPSGIAPLPATGPPPSFPRGPGEYTQVLSPPGPAPAPVPQLPPRPTIGPRPKGPSRNLLVWGLSAILVLAVLSVVLFALLTREAAPAAEPQPDEIQEAPVSRAGPQPLDFPRAWS